MAHPNTYPTPRYKRGVVGTILEHRLSLGMGTKYGVSLHVDTLVRALCHVLMVGIFTLLMVPKCLEGSRA